MNKILTPYIIELEDKLKINLTRINKVQYKDKQQMDNLVFEREKLIT